MTIRVLAGNCLAECLDHEVPVVCWNNQEHPASKGDARNRVTSIMASAGFDPTRYVYPTTVQRLHAGALDHSEIDIQLYPGKIVRLIGDSKGAGVFLDSRRFAETIGPRLCLTWAEVQSVIDTSYVWGAYGATYVCHNVTEQVLRELDIGSRPYSKIIKTYDIAQFVWGSLLPNLHSTNPAKWDASRSGCW